MNVNDAFPSKFLKASDIGDNEVNVTIDRVEMDEVGQGRDKEAKPILYFAGKKKGVVLNKTNATTISLITGRSDTDHWIGHRVCLFVREVEFQGSMVPAIRIKPCANGTPAKEKPKPAPAAEVAGDEDSIPF
jgi:hypothetical protein